MRRLLSSISILIIPILIYSQKVAVGHAAPVAKLDIRGVTSTPAIPGLTSSATLRIAFNALEGIDIGKSSAPPFTAWIQSGHNASIADPLSLQPLGGNVGIGTTSPTARLHIAGDLKVAGKITNVTNPTEPQDMATKAYVDLLQPAIMQLQGVKDIDNNGYGFVTIGTQVWLTENLRVTRLNNGTPIALVTDPTDWANTTSPAYTWYNNGDSEYGALYNFSAASTAELCPAGWHVPTEAEVYTLQTALGGSAEAGGKMKESGLAHWNSPNVGATNSSGFTSIPGGYRRDDGSFDALESHSTYWTNSFINPTNCWYFYTYAAGNGCDTGTFDNNAGLSVRCVKN